MASATSPFQKAVREYVESLSPKKKKHSFIVSILSSDDDVTAETVHESLLQVERKSQDRWSSRVLKKILNPVVTVLIDYYGIVDTLSNADPMPTAIIWGALKVVIDGLNRFTGLFETIKSELLALTTQLQRLTFYEDLYKDSLIMQEQLCRSYINLLRFWYHVNKECDRCKFSALLRAAASFSTKKLQAIIDDMRQDSDNIEKLAPIIEARRARGERENAAKERQEANLEREESKTERKAASAWRQEQQGRIPAQLYREIRAWLGVEAAREAAREAANEASRRRHDDNLRTRFGDTCDWLLTSPIFKDWTKGDTAHPALWLHGGPGIGKSTLCSRAIQYLEQLNAPVALHFYHFDQQSTAIQTMRSLAGQFLELYWAHHKEIPEYFHRNSHRSAADLVHIQDFILSLVEEFQNAAASRHDYAGPLTEDLSTLYILIDGIDEEDTKARFKEASKVLDFLFQLVSKFPKTVRLWFSTRDKPALRIWFKKCTAIDLKTQVTIDVAKYLDQSVPPLLDDLMIDELIKKDHGNLRGRLLTELKRRAQDSFLFATLMIKRLRNEVGCFDEIVEFIKRGLPEDLEQEYLRTYQEYSKAQLKYVSQVFSFVAFARRPLRLRELEEFICMISSENPKVIDYRKRPRNLQTLFAPLIEVETNEEDPLNVFCRLFHSTVKDFLIHNPGVLHDIPGVKVEGELTISRSLISDACLLYLRQDRYSCLLRKVEEDDGQIDWVTASGESMSKHHLLTYAAKYWDKHLDEVKDTEGRRCDVANFLRSSNYQTTLQVQSICVDGQFSTYRMDSPHSNKNDLWLKRVFPRWFSSHSAEGCGKFSKDYRKFASEWSYLLGCGSYHNGDPECLYRYYAGEIDRCMWGSLGPGNFLSSLYDRYSSFMMTPDEYDIHARSPIYHEWISSDGSEVRIVTWHTVNNAPGPDTQFKMEAWSVGDVPDDGAKLLQGPKFFLADNYKSMWSPYRRASTKVDSSSYRNEAVSFSDNMGLLRIGRQIFCRWNDGELREVNGGIQGDSLWNYFEEFSSRGQYIILARRHAEPKVGPECEPADKSKLKSDEACELIDSGNKYPGPKGIGEIGEAENNSPSDSSSNNTSISEPSKSGTSPKTPPTSVSEEFLDDDQSFCSASTEKSSDWNSAEESWSEGSTEAGSEIDCSESRYVEDNVASIISSIQDESVDSKDTDPDVDSSTTKSDPSRDEVILSHSQLLNDHASGGAGISFDTESEDEDLRCGLARAEYIPKGQSSDPAPIRASIAVYDIANQIPVRIFHYEEILPVALYSSPPAIHPSKPLVVWPLAGGNILFADFECKTYFIRRALPSSRNTRHAFMKCRFSISGRYLHIASLEAHSKPSRKGDQKKTGSGAKQPLSLSIFISTHRLSSGKTTRSPPTLVHRVKVGLGEFISLSVIKPPVTLTWTEKEAYVTCSSNKLTVYRVKLFQESCINNAAIPNVLVPKHPIFLPNSAQAREVYYFPPRVPNGFAKVIVGSYCDLSNKSRKIELVSATPPHTSTEERIAPYHTPPIGFYLDEEKDFGGWGISVAAVEIKNRYRDGHLTRKMEHFDAEDDCDIEHYI